MLALTTHLAPACSAHFQPLLAPPQPGGLPAVVELARLACPQMLRWAYDWSQASVEAGVALVSSAPSVAGDDFALVSVPLKPHMELFAHRAFVFEVVRDGETGQWRMAYAPGGTLRELTAGQQRQATALLAQALPAEQVEVTGYWE